MKKLVNLKGIKTLNRNEQKLIKGRGIPFTHEGDHCYGMEGKTPSGCPCAQGQECASSTCNNDICY